MAPNRTEDLFLSTLPFADLNAGAVLAGARNFRDLGGHRAAGGARIRHGRVFRSGHLGRLAAEDIALLGARLGPALRVVDLRGLAERATAPCGVPGATVHSLPIEPSLMALLTQRQAAGETVSPALVHELMLDAYRGFVRRAAPQFAGFLRQLLESDGRTPLVLHCTAGKDRTGFACAMLLEALEVPRETILQDYLHTNTRMDPKRSGGALPPELMRVLRSVRPEFLDAAYAAIAQDHGSVEAYLRDALGVGARERAALRALYLQPA
jgi:protein-tyrosine phosphatase